MAGRATDLIYKHACTLVNRSHIFLGFENYLIMYGVFKKVVPMMLKVSAVFGKGAKVKTNKVA